MLGFYPGIVINIFISICNEGFYVSLFSISEMVRCYHNSFIIIVASSSAVSNVTQR